MNQHEKRGDGLGSFAEARERKLDVTVVLIERNVGIVIGTRHSHSSFLDYGRKVGDGDSRRYTGKIPHVIAAYLGEVPLKRALQ